MCFCIVFLPICCGVSLSCCFVSAVLFCESFVVLRVFCCAASLLFYKFCVVFLALYDVALDANAVATVSVVFYCFVGVVCL